MQTLFPILLRAQAYYLVQRLKSWVDNLHVIKYSGSVLDISKSMGIQVIPMNSRFNRATA